MAFPFMKKQLLSFLLLLTGFISSTITSAQTLQEGWEQFKVNKIPDAIASFQAASANPQQAGEAFLGLSLCHAQNEAYDKAFEAFVKFYDQSPNPYPYVYALWTTGIIFEDYDKKDEAHLKFLKRILEDPKANGTMKGLANYMMAKHFGDSNKPEKELEHFAKFGAVDKWQVLGLFDNISASGYDKDWGALEKSGPNEEFTNNVGAKVKWFKAVNTRNDKWMDFEYHFEVDNAIMYAQTWVNSATAQNLYLYSGSSGSMKIWVNDQLVTEVEEERNCDMDMYAVPVQLNAGFNRVLVQIGESEAGNANFMIRFCDKDANPVSGLTWTNDNQAYTKAKPFTGKMIPFFAEAFFEEQVKTSPSLLNYLLLAEVYLRNDKPYESRKAMQQATKLAPQNCLVAIKQIQAYSRDKNYPEMTKTQERLKAEFPDEMYSLKLRIGDEQRKENFEEQEKLVKLMERYYGVSKYTEMIRLGLLANRKEYEELIKFASELYKKYPNDYNLMMLQYNIVQSTRKDLSVANVILQNYLRNNRSDNASTTLANNYMQMGREADASKIYLKRIENSPYAIGYMNDMAEFYFDKRDYENALKWQQKCREMAPYHSFYYDKIGKIYEAMDKPEEAKKAYANAIYYSPSDYDARKQLRKLEKKADLFEGFDCPDPVKVLKNAPNAEEYPEDNCIILLNNRQRVVYQPGSTEEKVELIVKIFNKSGIDTWKEYNVGYNSYTQRLIVEKVEVLKKDGSRLKAETNHNEMVFPNLEEGDGIHLIYRLENYGHGKLAQHFWDEFNFNYFFPVKSCSYTIIAPKELEYQSKIRNIDVEVAEVMLDNMKKVSWSASNLAAFKTEPYMPPLDDIGGILEITSMPNWNFVANWYSDLASTKAKAKFEVKETVAELFKGKTNLSDFEKGKLIYTYIADNFRYSNVPFLHSALVPQTAARTISTRLGDCKDLSTLFVAMCKEVGLRSNLVLVDTRNNGDFDFTLPAIGFNHCIARFYAGGKDYYVELTDSKLSFGTLPSNLLGSLALNIPTKTDTSSRDLIRLSSKNRFPNAIHRDSKVKFESNDMVLERKNYRMGAYASGFRNNYCDIGKEKQEKQILESVSSDFSNSVKLQNLSIPDLHNLSDTVTYIYKIKVSNELKEVIGIKLFKMPWTDAYSGLDFVSADERKFPFSTWQFDGSDELKESLLIELPAGKTLAEIPKNVVLNTPFYEYKLTFTVSPGKLSAVRQIKMKQDRIEPKDYAAFKDFMVKISEADNKQIGFK